jgi:hypothetical protein
VTGQQPRQGGQHHPVGGLEVGAVYLPAQHRDLVAEGAFFVGHRGFTYASSALMAQMSEAPRYDCRNCGCPQRG